MWQHWPVHPFRRADSLRRLAEEDFDVLVIGGGITGAGVALDAASRGLRTALVEKGDFASGTSSKSSKMVHGGIRYLQQREFRLVYENLAERQRLLDNAPHLVTPLPFLIPLFGRDGVVSKTVARSYSSALWMYDLTGGLRIGERHREVDKDEALAHLPTLKTEHLVAGFLYFDARADDARLTLTLLRTAAIEYGSAVANYAPVTQLTTGGDGAASGAIVRPAGGEAEELRIRARVVVNATGVWADAVRALDEGADPHAIRPAKGVHVTVPAERLPCDIAAVIPVQKDQRSIFVVSWPGTDLVYLGTTDTDYSGPLDDPACTPEDVDYLLEAANNLTTSHLTRADVTGVWAGLRPLLARPTKGHHVSERTADLSRRHTVRVSAHGVVTVTGGKLTTYRKMAQDTVDAVVTQLGESPRRRRCVTKSLRLIGAPPRPGTPWRWPSPGRDCSPATAPRRRRCSPWRTAVPSCSPRRWKGCPTPAPSSSMPPARRWHGRSTTSCPAGPAQHPAGTRHHGGRARRRHADRTRHGLGRAGGGRPGRPLRRVLPEGAPDRRARPAMTTPTPADPH